MKDKQEKMARLKTCMYNHALLIASGSNYTYIGGVFDFEIVTEDVEFMFTQTCTSNRTYFGMFGKVDGQHMDFNLTGEEYHKIYNTVEETKLDNLLSMYEDKN